jgi:hypothetical protein
MRQTQAPLLEVKTHGPRMSISEIQLVKRSTYPKAEKLQSHKATKREKRHRTSDLGSQDATSRSTTA